jgi:putative DNA primase/helicase
MKRNGWEFREAAKQVEAVIGSVSADPLKRERSDRDKREAMSKLWRVSKTVETGDPLAVIYFVVLA